MKFANLLPFILSIFHALLVVCIFGFAIHSPQISGLLPIIAYYVDYPLSIVLVRLSSHLGMDLTVQQRLLVDGAIFLLFGTAWYYFIGFIIKQAFIKMSIVRQ